MFLALWRLPMARVLDSGCGVGSSCRSGSRSGSGSASGKAALWRGRFRRFRRSGQTIAEFCAAEGVSTASFYQWRRRLAELQRPSHRAASRPPASSHRVASRPSFSSHRATGAGRPTSARRGATSRSGPSAATPNGSRLLVGRLSRDNVETSRRDVGRTPDFQTVRVTAGPAPISVHLPGGVRIEVPAEHLDAVRVLVEGLCRRWSTAGMEDGGC
jgi:hypothetical protein